MIFGAALCGSRAGLAGPVVLGFGMPALRIYRPTAKPVKAGAIGVLEVALLTRQLPSSATFGQHNPRFRLVETRRIQHFYLLRYRSSSTRRLQVAMIEDGFSGVRPVDIAIDSPT